VRASPAQENAPKEKEAASGRILKNLTFFWKKESKTKKTRTIGPSGRWKEE
jgi:hypothetical protein